MGGTVPVYFDTVGGALQLQPTGRVKVLATSGDKRSPLMPSLPTFVEAGYKDVVAAAWFAYYAPAQHAAAHRRQAARRVHPRGQFARGAPAVAAERHVPGGRRTRGAAEDHARGHGALGRHHAGRELHMPTTETEIHYMLKHLLRRLAGILALARRRPAPPSAQPWTARCASSWATRRAAPPTAWRASWATSCRPGSACRWSSTTSPAPAAGSRPSRSRPRPPAQNVLMLANPAVMVVAPLVFKDNGYDAERDFVPVSHVNDYEFALSVSTAVPVRELSHLLAWMRANPDKANVGVPATGSLPHFFGADGGREGQGADRGGRLPRLGAPADRPDRRAGADRRRHAGRGHPAAPGRQDPHPRDVGREALALRARGADLQGGRARPGRHRLERLLRTGEHAAREGRAPVAGHPRGHAGPGHACAASRTR